MGFAPGVRKNVNMYRECCYQLRKNLNEDIPVISADPKSLLFETLLSTLCQAENAFTGLKYLLAIV